MELDWQQVTFSLINLLTINNQLCSAMQHLVTFSLLFWFFGQCNMIESLSSTAHNFILRCSRRKQSEFFALCRLHEFDHLCLFAPKSQHTQCADVSCKLAMMCPIVSVHLWSRFIEPQDLLEFFTVVETFSTMRLCRNPCRPRWIYIQLHH